jgi:hypothetical protein
MMTNDKDNSIDLVVNSQSQRTQVKKKYFYKRVDQVNPSMGKLWFVFMREDNGDYIFQSDHLIEEEADQVMTRLNNLWALHHPDFPNPHKCCKGMWIPNKHEWGHYPTCSR